MNPPLSPGNPHRAASPPPPPPQGTHTAMKSGMLAAEAVSDALAAAPSHPGAAAPPLDLAAYGKKLRESWVHEELYKARNIRPSFGLGAGLWGGIAYSAVDTYLLRGGAPWTFRHRWALGWGHGRGCGVGGWSG